MSKYFGGNNNNVRNIQIIVFSRIDRQVCQIQELLNHLEQTSKPTEEYLENIVIPLDEELYLELCKALGSDRIEFMGIS